MASRNPDELEAELKAIEFEGDTQTLGTLRSEANLTVERQLATLADIDDKASRMLRLNVLLVGVVVSALSITDRLGDASMTGVPMIDQFQNVYVELGLASLVLSTAVAAITYTVTEYDGGVSGDNLTRLLQAELPHEGVEALLVKNYATRINFNRSANVRNTPLITATIVFAVTGVVLLTVGTYQAVLQPVPWWLAAGAILVVGTIVVVSGLVTQTHQAVRDILAWR